MIFASEKTSAFLLCILFILYIIGRKWRFDCTHLCNSFALRGVTRCKIATSSLHLSMYSSMYFLKWLVFGKNESLADKFIALPAYQEMPRWLSRPTYQHRC